MGSIERFWSKVDRSGGPDACWPWTGGHDERGYGIFYPTGERKTRAHRWLLGHLRGKPLIDKPRGIEDGCHRCDNPPCCNPAHLYVGTRKRNIADAVERSRLRNLQKTHCPQGHPYEGDNLEIKRSGARRCRTCARAAQRQKRTVERTRCKNGHPLEGDNVLLCKNGTRKCRICDAARLRRAHPNS